MKLKEAIDEVKPYINEPYSQFLPHHIEAIKLLIEAGKRVEDMRKSPCTTADEILPGETEE